MATPQEPDFPPGHPARFDYDPTSPEAQAWARTNIFPKGERDWPIGHPKAIDTDGNLNALPQRPGIDPLRPHHEEFSGRTPEQARAARDVYARMAAAAKESPVLMPTIGLNPPSSITQRTRAADGGDGHIIFCPACQAVHHFDSRWQFNGSLELPSFIPSMQVDGPQPGARCHSFVTNGRIQYLADSTHKLSGQTVELPPVAQLTETLTHA